MPDAIRLIWTARQSLPPSAGGSISDIVARSGWLHSAGGAGPYLALRARIPALTRKAADDAVFSRREIFEVPAVRDSTMLVPRADLAVALAAGRRAFAERLRTFEKTAGVTAAEISRLAEAVEVALADGPATSDALRARVPNRLVRDLGAAGKKLGSGTTLPLALRRVQLAGSAIRIAEERRLDGSRFVFARMPDAIEIGRAPADDAALDAELARRMLAWAAPATLDEIAWWAGIGKRAARAAVDAIGAKHEIRKPLGEVWSLGNESGAKTSPATPHFLPFRDNYLLFRRSLLPLVDEPGGVEVLSWKNEPIPLAEADSLHQNAIVIGGRLRGVWEFDPEAAEVAWRLFLPATRSEKRDVAEAAESLGRWIRDELGDARFYAFDTAKTRAPRIAFARGERG